MTREGPSPVRPAWHAASRLPAASLDAFFPARGRAVDGRLDDGLAWVADPSFWQPPRFAGRSRPVGLVLARGPLDGGEAVLAAALAEDGPFEPPISLAPLLALMEEGRVGGTPDLDDPGNTGLGLPRRAFALVVDPCDPRRVVEATALLDLAIREAREAGMEVLILRSPAMPAEAAPCLPDRPGTRRLAQRLAPWTLMDLAARFYAVEEAAGLLALAAGLPMRGSLPGGAPPGEPHPALRRLFAASRWCDPFREAPCGAAEGLALLGLWRETAARNRRVAVCLGMQFWKRERMAALFAHAEGGPVFTGQASAALSAARKAKPPGAVAAWATRMPPGFADQAREAGVETLYVEDGFIRSAGLGAGFLPGASYALDRSGPYYDPRVETDLERLLSTATFDPALLARAAALRQAVVRLGISKYNMPGQAPALRAPAGRPVVLVPGQVENDASVRWGGGAVKTNLALLHAAREARPEAWIVYKPHPDVTAGYRPGRIAAADLAGLADEVLPEAPIVPLLDAAEEVHTITSQTGFEALLRGRRVVTYGKPFYAGWGLTEDREPPARRHRRLTLDELVAGCLILYPRYIDPVTELPCTPECLIERLADPNAWRTGKAARLRRLQGATLAFLSRLAGRA
ncbi:beta-3-deoxy-D-manno-oct-2-ulosonic acid transferase [Acetobacteraceae bacterium H6797]|nr:beta-3-deoxy-D-manno-oct-2-ulosonic acid transferase [Acetobacteraceae bacterium H6797]